MAYNRIPGSWYFEMPEIDDWDDDETRSAGDRCLPLAAVFVAATGPLLFCNPRRYCYPRGFCYPRGYWNPSYFCRPRPCYPY